MKDRHREQQGGDDFDGLGHGWASVIRTMTAPCPPEGTQGKGRNIT